LEWARIFERAHLKMKHYCSDDSEVGGCHSSCELIEYDVIKGYTHNVQPVNLKIK
jgi:hypothetical protein